MWWSWRVGAEVTGRRGKKDLGSSLGNHFFSFFPLLTAACLRYSEGKKKVSLGFMTLPAEGICMQRILPDCVMHVPKMACPSRMEKRRREKAGPGARVGMYVTNHISAGRQRSAALGLATGR